jgi:Ca2+/H+ antiporter, TMEM165/GDT1 family
MDWKLLVSTYVAVFVAELGDKTQLATMSLASGSDAGARWSVFAGSALALVTTSALAVLAGGVVTRWLSPMWLHRIAGGVFLVLGALYLVRAGRGE